MPLYYSGTTGGFYDSQLHQTLPNDALKITIEEHQALLQANAHGARIEADATGKPQAIFPTDEEALSVAKDVALSRLTKIAQSQRQQVTGIRDEIGIVSLLNKYRLAQTCQAGTATPGEQQALKGEIKARALNENMTTFCETLIKRGEQLIQALGIIDGLSDQHSQALDAAKNETELETVLKRFDQQLNTALLRLKEAI